VAQPAQAESQRMQPLPDPLAAVLDADTGRDDVPNLRRGPQTHLIAELSQSTALTWMRQPPAGLT
jgi:hypothetical protein